MTDHLHLVGARVGDPARPYAFRPTQLAKAAAAAALVGAATPSFVGLVRVWGWRIAQPNLEGDYLFGLLWAGMIALSILIWPIPRHDREPLLVLWGAKCAVTLGFMLIYEWNYTLDSFGYYAAFRSPYPPASEVGFGDGTSNLMAMAWLAGRVMPDSFHALKVSFAAVGLLAIYLFYRAGVHFLGREDRRLLYVIGLFPSVLFWSSTLGKDPIQLLGIAAYVYGVVAWHRTHRRRYLAPLCAGLLLAASIRIWAGPILLLPLLVVIVRGIDGMFRRTLAVSVAGLALALGFYYFAQQFQIETMDDLVMRADALSRGWEGGSAQVREVQFTSLRSLLLFAPFGAFTALYRPLPGEVMNPFGLLAGFENLVLLVLTGLAIVRFRWQKVGDVLVLWLLLLVLTWSGIYAFASFYNLGAAVRFKLQILPILLGVLLHLSRRVPAGRFETSARRT